MKQDPTCACRVCASIPVLKTVTNFALPLSDCFNARPFPEQDLLIGRSSPHCFHLESLLDDQGSGDVWGFQQQAGNLQEVDPANAVGIS